MMGGSDLSRLALTSDLAQGLKKIFGDRADVFTGFQASKNSLVKEVGPKLSDYDKVVFATHGYFGRDLPGIMEPCLILTLVPPGTDGYLRMTEIMGLKINADIVALTACQTGLGPHISGEGTMGMGRAFQYAGTKSVLMSLWSVSEITSVELMKDFFKYLNEGKSKLEALRLARAELRKNGFDHPFPGQRLSLPEKRIDRSLRRVNRADSQRVPKEPKTSQLKMRRPTWESVAQREIGTSITSNKASC